MAQINTFFVDLSLIQYLNQQSLNYSHIVYLQYMVKGIDYPDLPRGKIKNDIKALGLVFEGEITERGKKLLDVVGNWKEVWIPEQKANTKEVKKEIYSKEFLEFWDTFPAIDAFTYNNIPFRGTRNLRTGKDRCNAKYNLILQEGKYTHQEILRALRYEVESKKDMSVVQNKNLLSYLKATSSWIQERVFENYVEISRRAYEPVSKKTQNSEIVI